MTQKAGFAGPSPLVVLPGPRTGSPRRNRGRGNTRLAAFGDGGGELRYHRGQLARCSPTRRSRGIPSGPDGFASSGSPRFVGRAIAAIAADPDRARWNQHSVTSAELAMSTASQTLTAPSPIAGASARAKTTRLRQWEQLASAPRLVTLIPNGRVCTNRLGPGSDEVPGWSPEGRLYWQGGGSGGGIRTCDLWVMSSPATIRGVPVQTFPTHRLTCNDGPNPSHQVPPNPSHFAHPGHKSGHEQLHPRTGLPRLEEAGQDARRARGGQAQRTGTGGLARRPRAGRGSA